MKVIRAFASCAASLALFSLLAGLPEQADAAPAASPTTWQQERALYRQAQLARKRGRFQEFSALTERLRHYPLYPYLKLDDLGYRVGDLPFEEVKRFATQYQSSPAGARMSGNWLRGQASRGRWDRILAHYAPTQMGPEFDCLYYRAKLATGKQREAFEGARALWMVPYDQASACDPLFEAWRKHSPITDAMAWQRMTMAYAAGKTQLATYLERYLSPAHRPIAQAWRDLHLNPEKLVNTARYLALGNEATPAITHALERLAIRDYEKVLTLWALYSGRLDFTREQQGRVFLQIGKFMTVHFDRRADDWLNRAWLAGARDVFPIGLRSALRHQDWERAERWLAIASAEERNQWHWQYWRARTDQWLDEYHAKRLLSRRNSAPSPGSMLLADPAKRFTTALVNPYQTRAMFPVEVKALLEASAPPAASFDVMARERHYYGFLSAERTDQPLTLKYTRYSLDQRLKQVVARSDALNRALEFNALGMEAEARRELFHAVRFVSDDEKIAAALIAHQFGWHLHAIQMAQNSPAQNDLSVRFPVLFEQTVRQHSRNAGIAPDWTYAIIRQESGFWQDALSPVGAMGYMQLMPATARHVAQSIGLRIHNTRQILQPDTNIRLGSTYLGQLVRQLDGNPVLATAAYNAGPGRARRWQPRDAPMPGDIWIETIPFQETREYVKNVMTYQAIYRHHLGKSATLNPKMKYIPVFRPR